MKPLKSQNVQIKRSKAIARQGFILLPTAWAYRIKPNQLSQLTPYQSFNEVLLQYLKSAIQHRDKHRNRIRYDDTNQTPKPTAEPSNQTHKLRNKSSHHNPKVDTSPNHFHSTFKRIVIKTDNF
ncbi:hypothetical protein [Vibrio aestuarianus]|uniref:hypothetical protein n=1 Tax=Vibrio aestuarianus TaxID=28171 RepID=UPI001B3B3FAD|nr:hypothetical protein [Vibrio aestuarianus]